MLFIQANCTSDRHALIFSPRIFDYLYFVSNLLEKSYISNKATLNTVFHLSVELRVSLTLYFLSYFETVYSENVHILRGPRPFFEVKTNARVPLLVIIIIIIIVIVIVIIIIIIFTFFVGTIRLKKKNHNFWMLCHYCHTLPVHSPAFFPKPLPISPVLALANTWFLCRPAD